MADIELGTDDLVIVACAAIRDRLAPLQFDGKPVKPLLGPVYPPTQEDLPAFTVHSPTEVFGYGAGRIGKRMKRIDTSIRVTLIFAMPIVQLSRFDQQVGRTRAQAIELLATDPHLHVDGKVLATDLQLQRIDKGFAGGGEKTVMVSILTLSCIIHAREGSRLPAHF